MKNHLLPLCFLAVLATGCATPDPSRPVAAQSVGRIFSHPYDRVYAAVLAAARSERLAVVETDQKSGRITLANRLSSTGLVETIDVAVTRTSAASSEVKVFSSPPVSMRDLPPNWGRIIDDRRGEFRESPSQRGGSSGEWGRILLARVGVELAALR